MLTIQKGAYFEAKLNVPQDLTIAAAFAINVKDDAGNLVTTITDITPDVSGSVHFVTIKKSHVETEDLNPGFFIADFKITTNDGREINSKPFRMQVVNVITE